MATRDVEPVFAAFERLGITEPCLKIVFEQARVRMRVRWCCVQGAMITPTAAAVH